MCPRCGEPDLATLADSPVPGAWQVIQCATCGYTWRDTEPARRTERAAYPERFRLTRADLDGAPEVPAVPPLTVSA